MKFTSQDLIEENLNVVGRQVLWRDDDFVQITLHQFRNNVSANERIIMNGSSKNISPIIKTSPFQTSRARLQPVAQSGRSGQNWVPPHKRADLSDSSTKCWRTSGYFGRGKLLNRVLVGSTVEGHSWRFHERRLRFQWTDFEKSPDCFTSGFSGRSQNRPVPLAFQQRSAPATTTAGRPLKRIFLARFALCSIFFIRPLCPWLPPLMVARWQRADLQWWGMGEAGGVNWGTQMGAVGGESNPTGSAAGTMRPFKNERVQPGSDWCLLAVAAVAAAILPLLCLCSRCHIHQRAALTR